MYWTEEIKLMIIDSKQSVEINVKKGGVCEMSLAEIWKKQFC